MPARQSGLAVGFLIFWHIGPASPEAPTFAHSNVSNTEISSILV
jgi:hypothetical protein